jgi:hypothetical protein
MKEVLEVIIIVLGINAATAFLVAFYFQIKLIFRLRRDSGRGLGVGDGNSETANIVRFFSGEIYTDLRPNWLRAVRWVLISYVVLFMVGGLTQLL